MKPRNIDFETHRNGQRAITTEQQFPTLPVGRMPRISRLMAFAQHFARLVVTGVVNDYAERHDSA